MNIKLFFIIKISKSLYAGLAGKIANNLSPELFRQNIQQKITASHIDKFCYLLIDIPS